MTLTSLNSLSNPFAGAERESTIDIQSQARAAAVLSNWKLTPATMMSRLDPSWIPAKWLQYLSLEIARAVSQGHCGLLISAPPRHGKSKLSTIATPLWCLENFPDRNVVIATYGEDLSTDFSREVRDLILNNQDQLTVRLRQDTQRVSNFLTTKEGGLKAVGLRGAITGRGADVLIIDDYIKEPKEAMSPTYLEDLWTWWLTVARTRMEPGAVVIILATRWVANDIHGRIMKQQQEKGRSFFKYISLPALAIEGEKDPIGRSPGEPLFPERYSKETILDLRSDLGTRWFNAMFQQRPQAEENVTVNLKWFKRITQDDLTDYLEECQKKKYHIIWGRSWDFASTKEAGDFTAGARGVYIKETGQFFIDRIARGQWSPGKVEERFTTLLEQDYEEIGDHKVGIEQEPGASGTFSIRHFKGLASKAVPGIRVREQRASTSKFLNAQPFLAAAEAGKIFFVESPMETSMGTNNEDNSEIQEAHWIQTLLDELEFFPEAEHDDQVDAVVNCYKLLSGKKGINAAIGRKLNISGLSSDQENEQHVQKGRSNITFGRNLSNSSLPRRMGGSRAVPKYQKKGNF